ncbi:MAG: hypothetical protein HY791_14070 [Deltaproteobacteria bacterium]|nr:hypothetical protein [Deltaproteobacteria bacterium]
MRRIWVEFLPPEELRRPSTLELLATYQLQPLVAVTPERSTDALGSALASLSKRGLTFGLWPLFSDAEGYWLNEANAARFTERVEGALAVAREAKATPTTVAFDLEPPLEVTRQLLEGPSVSLVRRRAAQVRLPSHREARARAETSLDRVRADLRGRFECLAAVPPPIALELGTKSHLIQRMLGTETERFDFDRVSAMAYTSLIAQALPVGGKAGPRWLLHETARALVAWRPNAASLSLGLVGTGKLGTEPTLDSPDELRADVAAALAAGVYDLALFSLEGVLGSANPEAWLDAFTSTVARAPRPSESVRWTIRGLRWGLRASATVKGTR